MYRFLLIILNLAVVVLELLGLRLRKTEGKDGFFRYYTVISNLLALLGCSVAAVFLLVSASAELPVFIHYLKFIAAVGEAMTMFVVCCVLVPSRWREVGSVRGAFKVGLTQGAMLYQHLLCPVITILSFLYERAVVPNMDIGLFALLGTIPTCIYAAVLMLLNGYRVIDGPYPFFRVHDQSILASVLWIAGLFAVTLLLALVLNGLNLWIAGETAAIQFIGHLL